MFIIFTQLDFYNFYSVHTFFITIPYFPFFFFFLFATDMTGLHNTASVTTLQEQSQVTLAKYISLRHPTQAFRFGKLLLLLPSLKAIRPSTLEQVFFRNTLGPMPISSVLTDLYKSEQFSVMLP